MTKANGVAKRQDESNSCQKVIDYTVISVILNIRRNKK